METTNLILGGLLLLAIIVPVFFIVKSASGVNKKVKKQLENFAHRNGWNPDIYYHLGFLTMALDHSNKKFIYYFSHRTEDHPIKVDLPAVKSAKIRSLKSEKNHFEWVGLELIENDTTHLIPFYEDNEDGGHSKSPEACLQDAKQWLSKLQAAQ